MCEFELLHLRYVGRYDRSASAKVLIIQFVSLIASGSKGSVKGGGWRIDLTAMINGLAGFNHVSAYRFLHTTDPLLVISSLLHILLRSSVSYHVTAEIFARY
jgi:hypothetical protein